MIACLVQRTQALAKGWIAQRDAERVLELVVACPDASFIEAQRKWCHHLVRVREWDFRWWLDSHQRGRKRDVLAGRGRLVVNHVDDVVDAALERSINRLRDVEDMHAVRDMPGLGDAMRSAALEPEHCVLARTIDPAKPQDG